MDARLAVLLGALVLGCEGRLSAGASDGSPPLDAGRGVDASNPSDAPGLAMDASTLADAPAAWDAPAPTDAPAVLDAPTDAPAVLDAPPPRLDAPPGTCPYSDPLALPITPCTLTVLPSTGDPHEDCVRRINQFRCECQHLPPLLRWTDGEACADRMAEYDSTRSAHSGFRDAICSGGYGQNECPGWPGIDATVSGCLQQMWDEGPGDFYGPPAHGHYINMSSTSFSRVACGFYAGAAGTWAVQNFQ